MGQPIALRPVETLDDRLDVILRQILNLLSGIHIAWAVKTGMVLILHRLVSVILCIEGIP